MEFFFKHKVLIFRTLGIFMLLLSFVLYFWVTPKEGISQNDKAAARVARMEASVKGHSNTQKKNKQNESTKFLDKLKEQQKQQVRYMLFLSILFGVGFVSYSFLNQKEKNE